MTKGKYAVICTQQCCGFAMCEIENAYVANGIAWKHEYETGHTTFLFLDTTEV